MKSNAVLLMATLALLGSAAPSGAVVGPTTLGADSGSCRLERFVDPLRRSISSCTITAATDRALIAGQLATNLLTPGGQQDFINETLGNVGFGPGQAKATFQGPGVNESWDANIIRGLVDVTAGERYTLTLYVPGNLAITTGATQSDIDELQIAADYASNPAPTVFSAIDTATYTAYNCVLPKPSMPETSDDGISYQASFRCDAQASVNLQFHATLHEANTSDVDPDQPAPYECGPAHGGACRTAEGATLSGLFATPSRGQYYAEGKLELTLSTIPLVLGDDCSPTPSFGAYHCSAHGPHVNYSP